MVAIEIDGDLKPMKVGGGGGGGGGEEEEEEPQYWWLFLFSLALFLSSSESVGFDLFVV